MENPIEPILEILESIELGIAKLNTTAKIDSETLLTRKEACK